MDIEKLCRRVCASFPSPEALCEITGLNEKKMTKMLAGYYTPNVEEVAVLSLFLKLSAQEHEQIFGR